MERKELIEFVEWFIKEPRMLTKWNYIEYIDEYYNSINSASNESQSVRENEGKQKKCYSDDNCIINNNPKPEDCDTCSLYY